MKSFLEFIKFLKEMFKVFLMIKNEVEVHEIKKGVEDAINTKDTTDIERIVNKL